MEHFAIVRSPLLNISLKGQDTDDRLSCPVCNKSFQSNEIRNLEEHVEQCLYPEAKAKLTASKRRLSKPVYNLMKDAELKKLLAELSLPTTGDRDLLIRRHTEYVILWNAECDTLKPKTEIELKRELASIERSWSRKAPTVDLSSEDFEEKAAIYREANTHHFEALIETAKRRKS